ncbi:glucan endo-1,3-beta-glucosidase 1 [Aristolochia californica]|uniref:glucan endo-1,3-beta-glucosidase 1 n=1 Tax=Aristolochia californica TaxID=171875 RepID=UPI0035E0D417
MKKVVALVALFFSLMIFSVSGEGDIELLPLHEPVSGHSSFRPFAVLVKESELPKLSSSVLLAESWLRNYVLIHFPSINISTIIVGDSLLCSEVPQKKWSMELPAMKNLYYSLVRWGLDSEIKVSAAFSGDCFKSPDSFRLKPLLSFLQKSHNSYTITPPPHFTADEAHVLVSTHQDFIKKLGFSTIPHVNIVIPSTPNIRKLSASMAKVVEPYPARQTPFPPLHSSIGMQNPVVPTSQMVAPPVVSVNAPPIDVVPPVDVAPANPPMDDFTYPPCVNIGPAPEAPEEQGLWCVAKPSVPAADLREALDFACGEGGADCEEISPRGRCYSPDNVVAHASFAFNSYWQKNKRNGGSCSFGGTAMIINSDPSFRHCHFTLL